MSGAAAAAAPAAPDPVRFKVGAARAGRLALSIGRMASGWLVLADTQPLRGYCQLLADPPVPDLNALDEAGRAAFALDAARAGDAMLAVLGAARINYETWCNLAPTLHTHVVPRYADEPADRRVLPMGVAYDVAGARASDPVADAAVMEAIGGWLSARGWLRGRPPGAA